VQGKLSCFSCLLGVQAHDISLKNIYCKRAAAPSGRSPLHRIGLTADAGSEFNLEVAGGAQASQGL